MKSLFYSQFLTIDKINFQLLTCNKNILETLATRWYLQSNLQTNNFPIIKINIDKTIFSQAKALNQQNRIDFIDMIDFLIQANIEYYLNKQQIFILHGAAVKINHHALVFIGPSGIGKSTILARLNPVTVLAEDTVLIKKIRRQFWVIPSVFDRQFVNINLTAGLLSHINCLQQGHVDQQQPLTKANLLKELLNNNLFWQKHGSQKSNQHLLKLLLLLSLTIPGYNLVFKPVGPLTLSNLITP